MLKRGEVVVRAKLMRDLWSTIRNAQICDKATDIPFGNPLCDRCDDKLSNALRQLERLGFGPKEARNGR